MSAEVVAEVTLWAVVVLAWLGIAINLLLFRDMYMHPLRYLWRLVRGEVSE